MTNILTGCMLESETDTMEIALRKRKEELISEGDIEGADNVESTIKQLDHVPICDELEIPESSTRGFSMMMRDRARNL